MIISVNLLYICMMTISQFIIMKQVITPKKCKASKVCIAANSWIIVKVTHKLCLSIMYCLFIYSGYLCKPQDVFSLFLFSSCSLSWYPLNTLNSSSAPPLFHQGTSECLCYLFISIKSSKTWQHEFRTNMSRIEAASMRKERTKKNW